MSVAVLCLLIVLAVVVLVKVTKTVIKLALFSAIVIGTYVYVWPRVEELISRF